MDPQEAARTANRLVTVLEHPQQTDRYSPDGPWRGGSSPGGPDGPAGGGAHCCTQRTVLVTVLEHPQQTDSDRLAALGEAVAALAARMDPQEAARTCQPFGDGAGATPADR